MKLAGAGDADGEAVGGGVRTATLVVVLDGSGGAGVEGEAEGVGGGFGAEVVHAGLEAAGPAVEVEGGELVVVGLGDEGVQGLALVDEGAAVGGVVDESLLFDLPDRLVEGLEVRGHAFQRLDGAFVPQQVLPHLVVPEAAIREIADEVLVGDDELAGVDAPRVQVGRVGLEALVHAHDLGRRGRRHGRDEQRVPQAVLCDLLSEGRPVPTRRLVDDFVPEVGLQEAPGGGGAVVGRVDASLPGEVAGLLEGGEVDGFEDLSVQRPRFVRVEREPHQQEGVREALHADADGPVVLVGAFRRFRRVSGGVDRGVQVFGDGLRDVP
mmetsp:Transcript_19271/g.59471  ORF Transcript_19271/g.59471 Transcript_19271/m.59471 type:complete len:324 (-) Transcript_19271:1134-2105(-)